MPLLKRSLQTVKDIALIGKRVVVRADLNVTLGKGLAIVDDTRIRQTLPTINYILDQGGSVILLSHLGDPSGKYIPALSLKTVSDYLSTLLSRPVPLVTWENKSDLHEAEPGQVFLLENLRFHPGEEANDSDFARDLAALGDIYVNDAFGVSHRKHASVVGIAKYLPVIAGLLLEREVSVLSGLLDRPERPFLVIVGGAKVSTKIGLLSRLAALADIIAIGGGMANTFLAAQGNAIGKSFYEAGYTGEAKHLLRHAEHHRVKILLPVDLVVGNPDNSTLTKVVRANVIPENLAALDIGPETEAIFGAAVAHSKTIVWNGPLGVIEKPEYARGTEFIYYALTQNTRAMTVVGGGDTLSAITKEEHLDRIDHLSTGGGAMLTFLEKGSLPALEVIQKK